MSSSLGSDGDEGGQFYHCHQCEVAVRPATLSPLTCPHCHGGFLEECPDSPPSSSELQSPWDYMGGFGQLLDDISTFLARTDVTVNPFLLFQSQMQNLLSVQDDEFASENGADFGSSYMAGDHLGPGLQQLIQHFAESESNRYGTPPAAISVIQALPSITISKEHLSTDSAQCAVCKDEFELCLQVTQMPCKHLYHATCILPWLAQHNSCPVCRFELPTDDPDYEQLRTRRTGLLEAAESTNARGLVEEIKGDVGASSSGDDISGGQQGASGSGTIQVCQGYGVEVGGLVTRRMLPITSPSLLDIVPSSSNEHVVRSSQGSIQDLGSNQVSNTSVCSFVLHRDDGIEDSIEDSAKYKTQQADPD
ncbi:hypothetical protein GOP47_0020487 [Adiantum capillus-veneris]|uniref:RING-type E3 ubiquitin transferase n=1 Tax=Adiantum capillus-veneris TaxID=13818 RepID=A0A9D4Z7S6_ADICA|nr:hypothetical protein GOP47_0020487 [Adiantum capillus-veneris]